jgi:ligand-binding SRPBCC domain-containing protein
LKNRVSELRVTVQTGAKIFTHHSIIHTTTEAIRDFHHNPKALSQLTPPPLFIQILRDTRVSLTEGEVEFNLWFGPVPVRWLARHEPGPTDSSFIDRMLKGPMAVWEHQHIFRSVESGVELTDRITLVHPSGWKGLFTRLIFDGLPLHFLFVYRHWRTQRALSAK